jgi:hypothetical protein
VSAPYRASGDSQWHTGGTRSRFLVSIWLNHAPSRADSSDLVMMGSGVRVPASASLTASNVAISSHRDVFDTRAAKITETRESASEIADWYTIGTRKRSRSIWWRLRTAGANVEQGHASPASRGTRGGPNLRQSRPALPYGLDGALRQPRADRSQLVLVEGVLDLHHLRASASSKPLPSAVRQLQRADSSESHASTPRKSRWSSMLIAQESAAPSLRSTPRIGVGKSRSRSGAPEGSARSR